MVAEVNLVKLTKSIRRENYLEQLVLEYLDHIPVRDPNFLLVNVCSNKELIKFKYSVLFFYCIE